MRNKFARVLSLSLILSLMVFIVFTTSAVSASDLHLKGMRSHPVPPGLVKQGYQPGEVGPYIIVFSGPIEEPFKWSVENRGAELVEYLPDFAFLAMMTPQEAAEVRGLDFVQDVQLCQPAYKVDPMLKDAYGQIKKDQEFTVKIIVFNEHVTLDQDLVNAHGQKLSQGNGFVVAKVHGQEMAKLVHSNNVKYVEQVPTYELMNDVAKGYMDVDDLWNLGYTGSNQIVGVCDTGLDTGVNDSTMHLDFQGRIDAIYALGRATADDPHGHGTHVTGSVLGDGARSNGQIQGMAPAAHVVFQSVLDSGGGLGGLPADLNDLFAQSWNAGARIHTNSWGAAVMGDYTTNSQEVDQYVWNNDMTILFAAGNDGNDWIGRTVYDSIGAPGTAKNCITVGASENYRPEKGTYADDPNQIAAFSSRGWTTDGRIKPDVVAPGTYILSAKSSVAPVDNYWEGYNEYYAYMGGTSMATPLTAGAVAVAREYMQVEWNHTPTPALMKAALINGATDLGFGVPSRDQGWGRVSLIDSLASKEYQFDDQNYSLATGQSQSFTYTVESIYTPLKVSLVWTDYPGSTTASKVLVNDLDLKVTSPSGTVYYGNDFSNNGVYDRLNNVENVFISSPEQGSYTIEIMAYNIPQGPQPFALFASGDFGVASGDITAPSCSISAPTDGATVSGTITYSASASDETSMNRVEFYVDGVKVGSDSTDPYSISWDTTTVSNGSHSLVAKAFDGAGNVGTSSTVTITVDNPVTVTYVTETFNDKLGKDQVDSFYISATATGTIDLDLSYNDGNTLYMSLYDPSGNLVAEGTTLISYEATVTGNYRIDATKRTGGKPTSYTLTATYPTI